MTLTSRSHLESLFTRPQVDRALLAEHAAGLICLTGGLAGEIPSRLLDGDEAGAREALDWLTATYGAENVFLEITENGLERQRQANIALIHLSHDSGVPLVATADSRYLNPDDARAHDALLCIGSGSIMDEEERPRLPSDRFYFRSPEEMAQLFADLPDALENTVRIAQRCNVDLRFDTPHMPQFPIPEDTTAEDYLAARVMEGLNERFAERHIPQAEQAVYIKRAEWELATINRMGYPGYFLIVWDIIRFAREERIPVGPGRGSAAGSLVSYALRITDLDPLPYNLLFERFLNPERVSLPDIDMDFCMDHRDRVIRYVSEKYGPDHVCQIITFGTMGAKAVLRDVARVLDFSYSESDRIAKLVPNTLGMTLKDALKEEPKLKELADTDPKVGELIAIARSLEGVSRHASTHAAGIIISADSLTRHCPLYRGSGGEVISQFAKDDAEAAGLVKFDLLGLKTLTVIDHAVQEIARQGTEINFSALSLDDPAVYALLCRGDTTGVFQLESTGMKDLIVKMQPSTFEDLVALLALYRPGPIGSGMLDDFIARKKGTTAITYDLPELEPILKETYGVIVYQEQVMRIANEVAGYSLGEADLLRRAMGKKKPSEMEKQKIRFGDGAKGRGIDPKTAEKIFDLMAYFAGYGFNKSHSAAYAVVSYQTAYLKAHYPVQFMASLLTNDMANPDKTVKNVAECREMGITLLPPDINVSATRFACEPAKEGGKYPMAIRYGLGAIKGVGEAALEPVVAARAEGPFADLFDLCRRVDLSRLNRRVLEAMITAGAMDAWGNRAQLMAGLPGAVEEGNRARQESVSGQGSLFGDTPVTATAFTLPDLAEWPEHERLVREKESLGFYLSSHPMVRFRHDAERYATVTCRSLAGRREGEEVRLAGILTDIRGRLTKKGERMAFLMIEDDLGATEVIAFPDTFREAEPLLKIDAPLLITGSVDVGDNGTKLRAAKIEDLTVVRGRSVRQITFRFTSTGLTRAGLVQIKETLAAHPGPCTVRFHVHVPGVVDAVVKPFPDIRINAGEQMAIDIERLLGRGAVIFA